MHKPILLSLALLVLVALISCDSSRKQIVGKWKTESGQGVWEFSSNGVLSTDGTPGRYSFGDNNRIKIQTSAATFVYQLEFQGDRMIWKDPNGSKMELTRVK